MAKNSYKVDRQIKRNTKSVLSERKASENPWAAVGVFLNFFSVLFSILLPLSLVALAACVVLRIPDFIEFETDRSGVLQELSIETTPGEIAGEVADFLWHRTEALSLTTEINRQDVPVFSFMDEVNLSRIRDFLDEISYPFIGAFVLAMIFFVICRLAERRRSLKYAMRASIIIYICTVCFVLTLALYTPFRDTVTAWQPGLEFTEGEILPRLLGGFYPFLSGGAICLISFIIYIALYSILIRFTVEKENLFS